MSGGVPASVTITWEGGAEVGVVMGGAKATFPTYSDAIGACKGFPVKTSCQGQCAIGSHGNAGGLEGTDVGHNGEGHPCIGASVQVCGIELVGIAASSGFREADGVVGAGEFWSIVIDILNGDGHV